MYQRVKAYVNENHMLTESDKVIVGVSGGADSVCLLFMLMEMQKEIGFSVKVVHVHHGLRGMDADADARFVQSICKDRGLEVKICHEDVEAYARSNRMTIEEAGREVRRRNFLEAMHAWGGTKIALAHHGNDNVETFLWNVCRGTGLKGLGGMLPVNGVWIRPLLCLKRAEVEEYLAMHDISYCTDVTNYEDAYTRNKIRNTVVPYLEREINAKSVSHIAEAMNKMQQLQQYIEGETQRFVKLSTKREQERIVLFKEYYEAIPMALRPYILHEIIVQATGRKKDIGSVHLMLTAELMNQQVGRQIDLPYGVVAKRCYEGICFAVEMPAGTEDVCLHKPEVLQRIIDCAGEIALFPQSPYTKWFDYDIIKNTVKIRHREPGDYISIDSRGRTQKLKRYFINEKIPQEERDLVWLAADGSHIMWIVGHRLNQMYCVTKHTKRILEIQINGGKKFGGDS